jgi:hypothetical protein
MHMPLDEPIADTARGIQHEPDHSWPASVMLQVVWHEEGRNRIRTHVISADQFFGRGQFGAPMHGDSLVMLIEQMRRAGPPPPLPKVGPPKHAEPKIPRKTKRHGRGILVDRKGAALRGKR